MEHYTVTSSAGAECGVVAEDEGEALDLVSHGYGFDTYIEMIHCSYIKLDIKKFEALNSEK